MTDGKQQASKKDIPKNSKFHDEFKGLPLEEKIKELLRMEALTLQETFSYGLNESVKAADRLGEVLADFGRKIEAEFKKATNQKAASASGTDGTPPPKT